MAGLALRAAVPVWGRSPRGTSPSRMTVSSGVRPGRKLGQGGGGHVAVVDGHIRLSGPVTGSVGPVGVSGSVIWVSFT